MSDRRPPTTLETRLSQAAIGCVILALMMVVAGIWSDWRWAATAGVTLVAAGLLAAANYTGMALNDATEHVRREERRRLLHIQLRDALEEDR